MEFPFQKAPLLAFHDSCMPWFLWRRVPLAVWSSWSLLSWPLLDSQKSVCMYWAHPPTLLGFYPLTCEGLFRIAPCPAVWASHAGKAFSEHPLTQPGRLRQAKAVPQRYLGVNLPGLVPASSSPEPVNQSLSLSASHKL